MQVYLTDGSAQTSLPAAADQTFYLTQSQCTDTRPTSPNADPMMPSAWLGNHWSTNLQVAGMTQPGERSIGKAGIEPRLPFSRQMPDHMAIEVVDINKEITANYYITGMDCTGTF